MGELVGIVAIIFIFGGFFSFLVAIILGPRILRSRERLRMHETLRLAIEKGHPVPPEMMQALQADVPKPLPQRDLRRGVILLCIAAAIAVFSLAAGQYESEGYGFAAIAAFPGFIGLGYLAFWLASRRKPA